MSPRKNDIDISRVYGYHGLVPKGFAALSLVEQRKFLKKEIDKREKKHKKKVPEQTEEKTTKINLRKKQSNERLRKRKRGKSNAQLTSRIQAAKNVVKHSKKKKADLTRLKYIKKLNFDGKKKKKYLELSLQKETSPDYHRKRNKDGTTLRKKPKSKIKEKNKITKPTKTARKVKQSVKNNKLILRGGRYREIEQVPNEHDDKRSKRSTQEEYKDSSKPTNSFNLTKSGRDRTFLNNAKDVYEEIETDENKLWSEVAPKELISIADIARKSDNDFHPSNLPKTARPNDESDGINEDETKNINYELTGGRRKKSSSDNVEKFSEEKNDSTKKIYGQNYKPEFDNSNEEYNDIDFKLTANTKEKSSSDNVRKFVEVVGPDPKKIYGKNYKPEFDNSNEEYNDNDFKLTVDKKKKSSSQNAKNFDKVVGPDPKKIVGQQHQSKFNISDRRISSKLDKRKSIKKKLIDKEKTKNIPKPIGRRPLRSKEHSNVQSLMFESSEYDDNKPDEYIIDSMDPIKISNGRPSKGIERKVQRSDGKSIKSSTKRLKSVDNSINQDIQNTVKKYRRISKDSDDKSKHHEREESDEFSKNQMTKLRHDKTVKFINDETRKSINDQGSKSIHDKRTKSINDPRTKSINYQSTKFTNGRKSKSIDNRKTKSIDRRKTKSIKSRKTISINSRTRRMNESYEKSLSNLNHQIVSGDGSNADKKNWEKDKSRKQKDVKKFQMNQEITQPSTTDNSNVNIRNSKNKISKNKTPKLSYQNMTPEKVEAVYKTNKLKYEHLLQLVESDIDKEIQRGYNCERREECTKKASEWNRMEYVEYPGKFVKIPEEKFKKMLEAKAFGFRPGRVAKPKCKGFCDCFPICPTIRAGMSIIIRQSVGNLMLIMVSFLFILCFLEMIIHANNHSNTFRSLVSSWLVYRYDTLLIFHSTIMFSIVVGSAYFMDKEFRNNDQLNIIEIMCLGELFVILVFTIVIFKLDNVIGTLGREIAETDFNKPKILFDKQSPKTFHRQPLYKLFKSTGTDAITVLSDLWTLYGNGYYKNSKKQLWKDFHTNMLPPLLGRWRVYLTLYIVRCLLTLQIFLVALSDIFMREETYVFEEEDLISTKDEKKSIRTQLTV
ncbi:hypothetical protein SNEBB_005557 [Seison nebaliae]|nr:hypothetical protein SNEBB_005557 [Seison nebaliae]